MGMLAHHVSIDTQKENPPLNNNVPITSVPCATIPALLTQRLNVMN